MPPPISPLTVTTKQWTRNKQFILIVSEHRPLTSYHCSFSISTLPPPVHQQQVREPDVENQEFLHAPWFWSWEKVICNLVATVFLFVLPPPHTHTKTHQSTVIDPCLYCWVSQHSTCYSDPCFSRCMGWNRPSGRVLGLCACGEMFCS